jgi:hypothetical protein
VPAGKGVWKGEEVGQGHPTAAWGDKTRAPSVFAALLCIWCVSGNYQTVQVSHRASVLKLRMSVGGGVPEEQELGSEVTVAAPAGAECLQEGSLPLLPNNSRHPHFPQVQWAKIQRPRKAVGFFCFVLVCV